jgi:hypothetical protein
MPIYLAHSANTDSAKAVSQTVKDRGLMYMRAKPCDVQVAVISLVTQFGYACYIRNLPAFMAATATGKVVRIDNRGYPINAEFPQLPWKLPKVIYDFDKALSDRTKDELQAHSYEVQGRGRKIAYVMHNVSIEKVRSLVRSGVNTRTMHVIGTVNIDALKAVLIIRQILSLFLLTHVYPAMRHTDTITLRNEGNELFEEPPSKKRKADTMKESSMTAKASQAPAKRGEERDSGDSDNRDDTIELKRAKPTQRTDEGRWGSVEHMPNASGVYVPFVRELAVSDTITLPTLLSTTFIKCLSDTTQGMVQQLRYLRAAWGVISTTDVGHEISHLSKCIDIAIQAQAIVYPIYAGTIYEGSIISGASFSIGIGEKVYEPLAYERLQDEVRKSSMHTRSINEISALLGNDDKGQPYVYSSIRELSAIAKERPIDEFQRQEMVKLAYNLCFDNRYWSTSPRYIEKALDLLLEPTRISNDIPMNPKYMFSVDPIECVLSAFGHQSFTFMIPNGSRTELGVGQPPKNFHVRTIAVESAVLDMKYMLENGYVTNNVQNLSSKHRDIPLKGDVKQGIWKALKEVYANRQGGTTDENDRSKDSGKQEEVIGSSLW